MITYSNNENQIKTFILNLNEDLLLIFLFNEPNSSKAYLGNSLIIFLSSQFPGYDSILRPPSTFDFDFSIIHDKITMTINQPLQSFLKPAKS